MANDKEEVISDPIALSTKKKVMRSLRVNSVLNSVSKVAAFVGGPLLAGSLPFAIKSIFEIMAGASAITASAPGFLSAVGAFFGASASLPIIGTMAIAALAIGIAVATDYAASRIWQSKQFDNYEFSAESTAHHLVREIQANNMCITTENKGRADGKTWVQYDTARKAAAAGQTQSL